MHRALHSLIEPSTTISALILGATAFFLFVAIAGAFSEPTAAPPGANVSPPINTSTLAQTKQGAFTLNGTFVVPEVCLSGSCRSIWPKEGRWDIAGSSIYYNNGNVGIGTTNPTQKLDVAGRVQATEICTGTTCLNPLPGKCEIYKSSCPAGMTATGSIALDGVPYAIGTFSMIDNGPYRHFERQNECQAVKACADRGWNPVVTNTNYLGFVNSNGTAYPLELACGARNWSGSAWTYSRTYECRPPTVNLCCF